MKNIIINTSCNITFLISIFLICTNIDNTNAKILFMVMLTFGNALYFMLSMKKYSSKYTQNILMLSINYITIFIYLYLITGQVIIQYILFYYILTFLGMKLGINKKRITDILKTNLDGDQK